MEKDTKKENSVVVPNPEPLTEKNEKTIIVHEDEDDGLIYTNNF